MTEEFDDDVVFENSPLFQYLHDLGHTDFEACPIASREKECGEEEEDITSVRDRKQINVKGGKLWRIAESLWKWTPFHQASATRKLQRQLDSFFGEYSVRCILDQDVLLQEDVELIELLDPSLLTLGSSPSGPASRATPLPKPSFIARPSVCTMGPGSARVGGPEGDRPVEKGVYAESGVCQSHRAPDPAPQQQDPNRPVPQSSSTRPRDRSYLQRLHPFTRQGERSQHF